MPSAALDAVITALADRSDVGNDVSGEELRAVIGDLWTPGRLPAGSTAWTITAAGMDITVGSPDDAAVVPNEGSGRQRDAFLVKQTSPATVTLDQSLATQARTDQVWLVVKQNALDATGSTEASIEVRSGAGGSSTAPPDDPDPAWVSAIRIGDVRVPAGATAPSTITRRIVDATLRARDALDLRYARADTNGRLGRYSAPSAFDNAEALPSGMSWSSVNASDGWPTNGTLVSLRSSNTRTSQMLIGKDGTQVYVRGVQGNGPAFEDWTLLTEVPTTAVFGKTETSTDHEHETDGLIRTVDATIVIPTGWSSYQLKAHAQYRARNIASNITGLDGSVVFNGDSITPGGNYQVYVDNGERRVVSFLSTKVFTATGQRSATLTIECQQASRDIRTDNVLLFLEAHRIS